MPKLVARKQVAEVVSEHWTSLVENPQALEKADEVGRERAWRALAWAQDNVEFPVVHFPVSADKSESAKVLSTVLRVLSAPPSAIGGRERLERARYWSSRFKYPLLDALCGVIAAEAGQVKTALQIFETLKSVGAAFPEVPVIAGRALLQCAGSDPKLLHRAEWYLMHAEHLSLNGDEEPQDDALAETEEDLPLACDADLDEQAQARLAEIWSLMSTLYGRLGDRKKSEMYSSRAGSMAEEMATAEESDESAGEFSGVEGLKPPDYKLIRAYFASPQFTGLKAGEQRQARNVIPYFVGLGRTFLAMAPQKLDRYSLEELYVSLIPEKMVATIEEMGMVPAVLVSYIHFMGKNGHLRDGARLSTMVAKLAGEFMANCRNSDCWSMSKSMAMQMLKSGVNLEDPHEVDRWLAERPARLLAG
jgi:hypothetical protein